MPWLALFLFAFSAWVASPVLACTCVKGAPPKELYGGVFEGKVTSIEMRDTHLRVTFDVVRAWHDVDEPTLTATTGLSDADCGYPFVEGESYLVFATGEPDWQVGLCSGTQRLPDADVDALGAPTWTAEGGLTVSDAAVSSGRDAGPTPTNDGGAGEDPKSESGGVAREKPKSESGGCSVTRRGGFDWTPLLVVIAGAAWTRRRRRAGFWLGKS